MLSARDVVLARALSTLKLTPALTKELKSSPALLKELRRACRCTSAQAGGETPGWLSRTALQSLPRSAQHRTLDRCSRPRAPRQPRANKPQLAAGTSCPQGRGDISGRNSRGRSGRNCAPQQPKGPHKPTAKGSDPSEPAISHEMAQRSMFLDMSEPMSGMPDGTTTNAQVANAILPAGELINKTPIFISGVNDTRAFLAWLRGCCPANYRPS